MIIMIIIFIHLCSFTDIPFVKVEAVVVMSFIPFYTYLDVLIAEQQETARCTLLRTVFGRRHDEIGSIANLEPLFHTLNCAFRKKA
mmetsp:Transcript_21461/g.33071  ORF Transcript_21461/g.33071 Transcript_21461/m.33071 type:complete len:86 (-) Transcript_21461:75-332(-)